MKKSDFELFKVSNVDVFEKHSIGLSVTRYVTDVNGTVIDKSLLPVNLQVDYPFFLLGEMDFQGSYYAGLTVCPTRGNAKFLKCFINGRAGYWDITGFSPIATIQNYLLRGDIVTVYTDDLNAPTFFIWIVVSYPGFSIASVMGNLTSIQKDKKLGRLFIEGVNFLADNVVQYSQGWNCLRFDNIGIYDKNDIYPKSFKNPYVQQDDLLELDIQFWVDQYIELASYIQFNTNSINFTLNIKKITYDQRI